jgi:hypothetical protein
MVTSRTTKRTVRARKARRTPVAAVRPMSKAAAAEKLDVAERKLRVVGRAAASFGRKSMHEVSVAAEAARGPMTSIWRTMRHAGKNIAKEASAAWRTVVPVAKAGPATKRARTPAA